MKLKITTHKNNPLYGNCQSYCLLSDISMLNNLADELRMHKNVHNSVFILITVAVKLPQSLFHKYKDF